MNKNTVIIAFNSERLKSFSLRPEIRQDCPHLINVVLEVLARAIQQDKEIQASKLGRMSIGKFKSRSMQWILYPFRNALDFHWKMRVEGIHDQFSIIHESSTDHDCGWSV